tara:strand:- start:146 stop:382 length:237 start_codon:yes stop_codon:yes gene_type:complete
MLQRKGKLKGKTKDTRLALFCIFAQILVSFVWDFFEQLSIERINFENLFILQSRLLRANCFAKNTKANTMRCVSLLRR